MQKLLKRRSTAACLGHREMLQWSLVFQKRLTHLQYEGKPRMGTNVQKVQESLEDLNRRFLPLFDFEEDEVFPFLARHIPKFESAIWHLKAAHAEFKARLNAFQNQFHVFKISAKNGSGHSDSFFESGTYLIHLLRYHVQAETRLYQALEQHLRPDEKADFRFILSKSPYLTRARLL